LEALRAGTPLQAGVLTEVRELALTQGLKRFDLSDAEPAFLRHAQARIAEPE
jgi:hypothetical protein